MDEPRDPEKQQQWTASVLFFYALLQLLLVHIAYRVDRAKTVPIISTASWAILFGIALGGLLSCMSRQRASHEGLDPPLLFFGLLPPIILEAGFNTQRKGFFSNFMVICLLALAGTVVASLATGFLVFWLGKNPFGALLGFPMTSLTLAEALLYGALISAIDPISTLVVLRKSHAPPLLFNLLFGESVINDAVAIVLFGIFQKSVLEGPGGHGNGGGGADSPLTWMVALTMLLELVGISLGSVVLAAAICYTSAFLLRHADAALKQHPTYEISTLLLSAYASYVAAQSLQLSGLLAVFFSGVFIRHYHMYSISHASAAAFSQMLSNAAFLAENFIYLYLGASLLAYSDTFRWDWTFISVSLCASLIARALNIFPLCGLANLWRTEPIPVKYMVVTWFSGLRGSVAFALALNVRTPGAEDHAAVMRASTLVTVILTTMLFGAATGPLVHVLGLSKKADHQNDVPGQAQDRPSDEATPLLAAVDELIAEDFRTREGNVSSWSVREIWVGFDEKHLKPIFGGNPRTLNA